MILHSWHYYSIAWLETGHCSYRQTSIRVPSTTTVVASHQPLCSYSPISRSCLFWILMLGAGELKASSPNTTIGWERIITQMAKSILSPVLQGKVAGTMPDTNSPAPMCKTLYRLLQLWYQFVVCQGVLSRQLQVINSSLGRL